jgi:hypothetical protein
MSRKSELRLVTLESFYDSWDLKSAQDLLLKALVLKLRGYTAEYAPGVLPIDTTDFVGTHHVIGWDSGDSFEPVMGYKSFDLGRCAFHNLTLAPLAIIGVPGHADTREDARTAVRAVIEKGFSEGRRVTYDSSWTIDPEVRKDRALVGRLRELLLTTHVFHTSEVGQFLSVTAGMLRFKTDETFAAWGYRPILTAEGKHANCHHAFLKGEKAVMMAADSYNEATWATARRNEEFWRNRHVIGSTERAGTYKKAA